MHTAWGFSLILSRNCVKIKELLSFNQNTIYKKSNETILPAFPQSTWQDRGWKQEQNPVFRCWLSGNKFLLNTVQWRRKWSCSPHHSFSREAHIKHKASHTLRLSVHVIQPLPSPSSHSLSLHWALNLQSPLLHCFPSLQLITCTRSFPELQGKIHSSTLLPFSFCFPPMFGLSCVSPHPLSSSLFGPRCSEHLSCCCVSELLLLLNSHFQSTPHYLHRLFVLKLIVVFLHAFTFELFTCLCCWKSSLAPFQWHPSFAPSGLGPCAKLV